MIYDEVNRFEVNLKGWPNSRGLTPFDLLEVCMVVNGNTVIISILTRFG